MQRIKEETRQEKLIPSPVKMPDSRGGDDGYGVGQKDRPPDPPAIATVHGGGILQFLGQTCEELPKEKDVEGIAEERRQDQRPVSADGMNIAPEKIHGDEHGGRGYHQGCHYHGEDRTLKRGA